MLHVPLELLFCMYIQMSFYLVVTLCWRSKMDIYTSLTLSNILRYDTLRCSDYSMRIVHWFQKYKMDIKYTIELCAFRNSYCILICVFFHTCEQVTLSCWRLYLSSTHTKSIILGNHPTEKETVSQSCLLLPVFTLFSLITDQIEFITLLMSPLQSNSENWNYVFSY